MTVNNSPRLPSAGLKRGINPRLLNALLAFGLLAASASATLWGLADFAALPSPDGGVTDWRGVVLLDVRYPRIVLAILAGAVLAVSGNAMQGLLQNPLASPGLLGSAGGATTTSVFILYYFSASVWVLLFGGILGALASFLLVYLIAKRHGTTMMILAGVAVNSLLAAAITLLLSHAKSPWALAELYRWLQGSLGLAQFSTLAAALPFIVVGLGLIYSQRRYIDLLTFGEETAATMGINPQRAFFLTAVGVAMSIGAIIPQTGAIGFIGLIAPHLARLALRRRPSQLYLTVALIGALLLLGADLLVWRVSFFSSIYVGTLTSIIGAPFLLWVLLQQQRRYDN